MDRKAKLLKPNSKWVYLAHETPYYEDKKGTGKCGGKQSN